MEKYIALAIFAYVADKDWNEQHALQRQGIKIVINNRRRKRNPKR